MGNAMHITASVFINDNDSGLHEDYKKWLEGLAPFDPSPTRYAHNRTGEDNADAHMKRQVMGREVVVAITHGKLLRRIRRPPSETRAGEGDRRVNRPNARFRHAEPRLQPFPQNARRNGRGREKSPRLPGD
ncbi:MAG TPA: YjbQ family protein [Planctomycetaceae bacterium]|jgi:hypothetical protein|nr:YjbQ family protein [Planctomycetaceae bacterium]